ncbi:MAG: sensor histidine kinase [Chloroflexi bacterium]|nr:sensor histidine kinase [Chloroflexota bacterium]
MEKLLYHGAGSEAVVPGPEGNWYANTLALVHRLCIPNRRIHIWLLLTILLVSVLLHYGDRLPLLSMAAARTPIPPVNRQTLERILFLLPIIYGSVVFGERGGLVVLGTAMVVMAPRAFLGPGDLVQALLQTAGVSVTGGLFVWVTMSERKRVADARAVTQRIIVAQENERQQTARDLHDETLQSLYLLSQRLDQLASGVERQSSSDTALELRRIHEIAAGAGVELRRVLQALRPRILDDMGLVAALEWLADELFNHDGCQGRVEVHGALPELPPQTQLLLWRIAQEALYNAAKHAQAREVVVSLQCRGRRLSMSVRDNGKGFDAAGLIKGPPPMSKLGILGIQERARLLGATLSLHSEVGKGTTVTVEMASLPIE